MRFPSNDHGLLIMKVSQCLDMLDSSDCTTTSGGNEREEDIGSGDTTGNHQCRKDKENQLVGGGSVIYFYVIFIL